MVDLRRARATWSAYDVTVRDLPLAVALAAATLVPSLQENGTQLGDLPDRPTDAVAVVAVALQALPLVLRRRRPDVCLALVSLGFAIDQLRGYHTVAGIALPIALFSAGAHLGRGRRTVAVAASVGYVALAAALAHDGSREGLSGSLTFYVVLVVAWGLGAWLRQTRAAEAERRRLVAETVRATERASIARELHDVVTHHVTAMVVQSEAARYVTGDPARLDTVLAGVADTGRRAIDDLRHLLDVLDPAHDPDRRSPTVGEVEDLVEQARMAGQPVEYRHEGPVPDAPGSAEVAAYRVVQEALTNALKHARGSRTLVQVRRVGDGVHVEVTTAGGGLARVAPDGSGRGLTGLRERVDLLGGSLSAGAESGAFVVRAWIPSGGRA